MITQLKELYSNSYEGPYFNNIIRTAKKHKADLIVVGTHGKTGLKKVLFGSVTTSLIEESTIPLIAVPHNFEFQNIDKIVYASDMKKLTKEINKLIPIAIGLNAKIEVLFLDYLNESRIRELQFDTMLSKKQFKNIELNIQPIKSKSEISNYLTKYISKKENLILAMFPESRTVFDKLFFQSKTENIAYRIKKPILSIQK